MLDILEMFVVAQYNKEQRKQTLRHINIAIERLRYLIRLSKDLHCLSMAHYEFAVKQMLELGKMGWRLGKAICHDNLAICILIYVLLKIYGKRFVMLGVGSVISSKSRCLSKT